MLAFGLTAAACGGDEALSKEEYLAQADAICAETNAQIEPIALEFLAQVPDDATIEEFDELPVDEYVSQYTALLEEQLTGLRALPAPSGDEELLAELFDDVEATLRSLNGLVAAAQAGDESAIQRLTSPGDLAHGTLRAASTAFEEVSARGTAYGFSECGGE